VTYGIIVRVPESRSERAMSSLTPMQEKLCDESRWDYAGWRFDYPNPDYR
jgi:hypothetical protein